MSAHDTQKNILLNAIPTSVLPIGADGRRKAAEASLYAACKAAGVAYPRPDTSSLDEVLATPSVRDLMLRKAQGERVTDAMLAKANAADSVREDVAQMKHDLFRRTVRERRASVAEAIADKADEVLRDLGCVAAALDPKRPLDPERAFELDATSEFKRAVALLGDLGSLAAFYGRPIPGNDPLHADLHLLARFVETTDVVKRGDDDLSRQATNIVSGALGRGRHTLDEVVLMLSRRDIWPSIGVAFARSEDDLYARIEGLERARYLRRPRYAGEPVNTGPAVQGW